MKLNIGAMWTDGHDDRGGFLAHFEVGEGIDSHAQALRYLKDSLRHFAATLTDEGDEWRGMIEMYGWNWGDVVDHWPKDEMATFGITLVSVTPFDAAVDLDDVLIEPEDLPATDYGTCELCGEAMEGDGNLYENADGAHVCQYCL